MRRFLLISLLILLGSAVDAQTSRVLLGRVISDGSDRANQTSKSVLDGSTSTVFNSDLTSHAWVGLDLNKRHVITGIKWLNAVNENEDGVRADRFAIFEGANRPDFFDAIPLYMVTDDSNADNADVVVTRGFRYVRFVAPNGSTGNLAELRFLGFESEGADSLFYQPTNLPLVVLHTETGLDPKDTYTKQEASASVIYVSKTGKSKIVGDTVVCNLRGRGNDSWNELKGSLRIKYDKKVEMPYGAGKFKKWVLLGNLDEKTLMRNTLAFDLSRRLEMEYTPYCQPVDVVMNGEFKGTYMLCDQPEAKKHRVNLNAPKAAEGEEAEESNGYFYEYDGNSKYELYDLAAWHNATPEEQAQNDLGFYTDRYEDLFTKDTRPGNPVTIKSPQEDDLTQEQFDYLKSWVNAHENEIYHKTEKMEEVVDFESFARYFLVNEMAGNTDAFYELYQYKKHDDEKVYFGPCWDFDLAFSNDGRVYDVVNNPNMRDWLTLNGGTLIEGWTPFNGPRRGHMKDFVNALLSKDKVNQAMREIWAYARTNDYLSNDTLQALVNEYAELLDQSQTLNFQRWPYLGVDIHMNYDSDQAATYQAQVDRVRSFIKARMTFMDRKLSLGSLKSVTLTVPAEKWTTVYLPYSFVVPEGLDLYTVVPGDEEHVFGMEKVTIARPNRPYLVNGEPGKYTLNGYLLPKTDLQENGLLTGCAENHSAPAHTFVLRNGEDGVGFYLVHRNENVVVNATKAYMTLPTEISDLAASISLDGQIVSGIAQLMSDASDVVRVYNMEGRLLYAGKKSVSDASLKEQLGTGIFLITNGSNTRKVIL